MQLGRRWGEKNKIYTKVKTNHKTTVLKFPYQHLSVKATPLLHFRHRLVPQQWLSDFLPETHTHKYSLCLWPIQSFSQRCLDILPLRLFCAEHSWLLVCYYISLEENSDHNPLHWFYKPLMGQDPQFEKHWPTCSLLRSSLPRPPTLFKGLKIWAL